MLNDAPILDRDTLCSCSAAPVSKIGKWFTLNSDLNRLLKFNRAKGRWSKKKFGIFLKT